MTMCSHVVTHDSISIVRKLGPTLFACLGLFLIGCQGGGHGNSPGSVGRISESESQDDVQPEPATRPVVEEKPTASVEVASEQKTGSLSGSSSWSRLFGGRSGPPKRIPLPRTDEENVRTVSGNSQSGIVPIDEF